MTTMTFDKLAYIDRLKAAGFAEPQARAMADGLDQALREEVATKSDIAGLRNEIDLLRAELRTELGTLRGELNAGQTGLRGELNAGLVGLRGELDAGLAGLRGELDTGLAGLRGEFNAGLAGLRGELSAGLAGLRGEMKADKIDLLKWVVMLIVGQTAVFTALKLLGH